MIQGKKYVGDSYEQGPLKIQCNQSGAHVLILCAQILWVTQKVIQLLLIKSPFVQQTTGSKAQHPCFSH